jgi:hypothetical protein
MEYFFAQGDQQRGPYTLEQLAPLGLKPDTLVWHDGLPEWKQAGALPELASLFAPRRPIAGVVPPAASAPAPALVYQTAAGIGGHTNGMAIASLVLGIVGLVTMVCYFIGILPGILAIVFGVLARKQIRLTGEQGSGIATAGLICGWIAAGLPTLIFLVLVIYFMARGH